MQGEGLGRGRQRGLHHIRADPQHVPRDGRAMFGEKLNRFGQKHFYSKVLQDLQGRLMDGLHAILRENTLRLKRMVQDRRTVRRIGRLSGFAASHGRHDNRVWAARNRQLALAPLTYSSINGAWMKAIFQI